MVPLIGSVSGMANVPDEDDEDDNEEVSHKGGSGVESRPI